MYLPKNTYVNKFGNVQLQIYGYECMFKGVYTKNMQIEI